jgi:release factor glutamine methyltransferase
MDVGTGSGCMGITLALELPRCKIMASDVSSAALKQARANARQLQAPVEFVFSDALNTPLPGNVDVVVSNPPYIPTEEKKTMNANVIEHEPHMALFVPDDDSLIFYKQILLLNPFVSEFWFEIHELKKEILAQFMHQEGLNQYEFYRDMQDKYRILHIKR